MIGSEETTDLTSEQEAEFDAAWGEGDESGSLSQAAGDDAGPGESDDNGEDGKEGGNEPGKEGRQESAQPDAGDLTPENLQKQVKDNQAWATAVTEENKALKAKIETLMAQGSPPEKGAVPGDLPEDLQVFAEDYPEVMQLVRHYAQSMQPQVAGDLSAIQADLAQVRFDNAVIGGCPGEDGKWIDGHPDAFRVLQSPEFTAYTQAQKLNLDEYDTPVKAIGLLNQFKESVARAAADTADGRRRAAAGKTQDAVAGSLQSPAGRRAGGKTEIDKDDFDAAFDDDSDLNDL